MALSLPANFRKDIQGRDTNLFPVIQIGQSGEEPLLLTTGQVGGGFGFKIYDILMPTDNVLPILLNIPAIREGIDPQSRIHKTSNLNINISNYPYNGKRFSEIVVDHFSLTLLNKQLRVYWCSPNSDNIVYYDYGDYMNDNINNALHIFTGVITRYDHGDETATISAEDFTESWHKEVPMSNMGSGGEVPDRYKNKPIPIVYGEVDKSPCVAGFTTAAGEMKIYADSDESGTTIKAQEEEYDGENYLINFPLLTFASDVYMQVVPNKNAPISDASLHGYPIPADIFSQHNYTDSDQYRLNENTILMSHSLAKDIQFNVDSPLAENLYMIRIQDNPIGKKLYTAWDDYEWEVFQPPASFNCTYKYEFQAQTEDDNVYVRGWNKSHSFIKIYPHRIQYIFADIPRASGTRLNPGGLDIWLNYKTHWSGEFTQLTNVHEPTAWCLEVRQYPTNIPMDPGDDPNAAYTYDRFKSLVGFIYATEYIEYTNFGSFNDIGWVPNEEPIGSQALTSQTFEIYPNWTTDNDTDNTPEGGEGYVVFSVQDITRFAYILAEGFREADYYADVLGRKNWSGTSMTNIHEILNDLLLNELGVHSDPMHEAYASVKLALQGAYEWNNGYLPTWKNSFTINEKIHSKELITALAASTPYIPHFDSINKFSLIAIREEYTDDDLLEKDENGYSIPGSPILNSTILEDDVINFSFSRTKIEDVYTQVEVKYNWDYAREEFTDTTLGDTIYDSWSYMFAGDMFPGWVHGYYGLTENNTLVIDDDRGKYIRDKATAENLAVWMLAWSCNQHLKIKVKLPLKYLNLEVGDIIKFKTLIGGIKPYGIDYTSTSEQINGQPVFNKFMIISTNKTIDYCEIETMQMHNLKYCESHDYDCSNSCDGNAVVDECGVCAGSGAPCEECAEFFPPDCTGECGGDATIDICGVCGGEGATYLCENGSMACDEEECQGFGCIDPRCATHNDAYYDNGTITGDLHEGECFGGEGVANFMDCGSCWYRWHRLVPVTLHIIQTSPNLMAKDTDFGLVGSDSIYSLCDEPTHMRAAGMDVQELIDENSESDTFGEVLSLYGTVSLDRLWYILKNHPSKCAPEDDWDYYGTDAWNWMENCPPALDGGEDYEDLKIVSSTLTIDSLYPNKIKNTAEITINEDSGISTVGTETISNLSSMLKYIDGEETAFFDFENIAPEGETIMLWLTLDHTLGGSYVDHYGTGADGFREQVKVEYEISKCAALGDINGDGGWSVLDIVQLSNCILQDNCHEHENGCAGDTNGDSGWNVLDIVKLSNCILADDCECELNGIDC